MLVMREVEKIARRHSMEWWRRCLIEAAFWLAPCVVMTGGAQYPPGWLMQRHAGVITPDTEPGQNDNGNPESEKRLRALNADRQKALVADTNKLLKLATELDAEISHSNPSALTADQLHKVAEIEKLAKSVREKMSTSVRTTPVFRAPFGIPPAE